MVIHIHHGLRKMFLILVWNEQQPLYLHKIHIIDLLFVYAKLQSIASLLNFNINLFKLYTIVHSHQSNLWSS